MGPRVRAVLVHQRIHPSYLKSPLSVISIGENAKGRLKYFFLLCLLSSKVCHSNGRRRRVQPRGNKGGLADSSRPFFLSFLLLFLFSPFSLLIIASCLTFIHSVYSRTESSISPSIIEYDKVHTSNNISARFKYIGLTSRRKQFSNFQRSSFLFSPFFFSPLPSSFRLSDIRATSLYEN